MVIFPNASAPRKSDLIPLLYGFHGPLSFLFPSFLTHFRLLPISPCPSSDGTRMQYPWPRVVLCKWPSSEFNVPRETITSLVAGKSFSSRLNFSIYVKPFYTTCAFLPKFLLWTLTGIGIIKHQHLPFSYTVCSDAVQPTTGPDISAVADFGVRIPEQPWLLFLYPVGG